MSDYLVVGKKGTGKSKYVVMKIHEYLSQGRRVATNIDIDLSKMCNLNSRATIIRLPDKPTLQDLEMIGLGTEEIDEEKNGGIFLDECAVLLNARDYQDKTRGPFIDFCVHGRKLGWDMWLLCQGINQIDKQIRENLLEYVVSCMRLDKVKIPGVGWLISFLTMGKHGKLKMHYASIRLMEMPNVKIDSEFYRAKFYEQCYNTRQKFSAWPRDPKDPRFHDFPYAGPYSVLSAWHLKGRYQKQSFGLIERLVAWFLRIEIQKEVPPPRKPISPELQRVIDLVKSLPEDQRIRHFKRLQETGVL